MIPINSLVLDLSRMILDQRTAIGESDANHDYPEALLVLAINRAVRDLFTALFDKESTENIIKIMPSLVKEVGVPLIGGQGAMPSDAHKGITIKASVAGGEVLGIYITPEKWYAIQEGYNSEEFGTSEYPRWTEFDRIIRLSGLSPADITYLYIKNYTAVAINGNIDIEDRYYNQILDLAYAFIMKLTPIQ